MMSSNCPKTNSPFRFENWWLMEQDFNDVAKQSWAKSSSHPFHLKTKYLVYDLKKWRKGKPNITSQLSTIENLLLHHQSKPSHLQDFCTQKHLISQHEEFLKKNEEFHLQRAKKQWARLRDRNTAYFHQAITKRNRKNTIAYLYNPHVIEATSPDQLATTLLNYFHDICGITANTNPSNLQNLLSSSTRTTLDHPHDNTNLGLNVQHNQNSGTSFDGDPQQHLQQQYVNSTPTVQELHTIIKNMRNNASQALMDSMLDSTRLLGNGSSQMFTTL